MSRERGSRVSLHMSGLFRVGLPGLEPGTSSLSEMRSNQLSYRPGVKDTTGAYRRDNVQHGGAPDKPIAGPGGGQ